MFKALKAIFRFSLHTVAYTVCALIIAIYVAVRVNLAGTAIERLLTDQLSELISTPVQVGKVEVNWINQIVVTDLRVDTILYVRRAMVGYNITPLLFERELHLSTAQFIDFSVNLSRDTTGVLNIQPIIDAVSRKDDSNDPLIQQFQIGTLHLRRGDITFYNHQPSGTQRFGISDLNSNVHIKDNNLDVRQLTCFAQTPFGSYNLEGSLSNRQLYASLGSSDLSASVTVRDISRPVDSLFCSIDVSNYYTTIPKFGPVSVSGTASGILRQITLDLHADTPIGRLHTTGSLMDTTQFVGSITSPRLDLQPLSKEKTELLSHHIYNAHIDLDVDRHKGGDVSASFTLNDSLLSADVAVATSVYDIFTRPLDLSSLSTVKLEASLHRLSIPNAPEVSAQVSAEVDLNDREGYMTLSDLQLRNDTSTISLDPLIIEGTRYRGYIKGPVLIADYSRDKSSGQLHVSGRIPSVNHIIQFLDIPVHLSGSIPIELRTDSTFTLASGHIGIPAFRINTFQYDDPLNIDLEADINKRSITLHPLNDIDLTSLLGTIGDKSAHVGGLARGPVTISDGIARADLNVRQFSYIDTLIGTARIAASYDFNNSYIGLDAHVDARTGRPSHITGGVALIKHSIGRHATTLNLDFQTDSLPLGFINVWTGSFLQDFTGTVSGHVALAGPSSELILTGNPRVDGTFTHDLVGTRFHLHDSLVLDTTSITFRDAHVYDDERNLILVNADITHQYLDHFIYDVRLRTDDGFLLFDKPESQKGAQYWGQLYTNGTAQLTNTQGPLNIELDMTTAPGSWLNISPYAARIDDKASYSFLTFRDANTTIGNNNQNINNTPPTPHHTSSPSLLASLRVTATEQCRISVRIDPLSVTDELQCRGNGNLVLLYDPRNDLSIGGIFNITSGNYNINMQGGLLNKVFRLQSGSSVHFNGLPSDADLNINATYNVPSANLKDLDENIATLGSLGRTTVPVDCQLAVTGQLSQPQVGFDLSLRNVSDEVQAYVHNIIGTPEMLNQEVLYLLLFNRFYTPDYAQQSTRTSRGGGELASFATSSVTAGINQLLNKVSDHVSIGSSVTSERGDFSDVEADISLTTRFLDNRLVLGGNFGYRDPSSSLGAGNASKFVGDFDAEFLMNTRGTVRFKAYSHSSQRDYNINNAQTTQGVGIIIRKDF